MPGSHIEHLKKKKKKEKKATINVTKNDYACAVLWNENTSCGEFNSFIYTMLLFSIICKSVNKNFVFFKTNS